MGTYPLDKVEKAPRRKGRTWYIVNLDPAHMKGSHWVAIEKNTRGPDLYFDSYGDDATEPQLRSFLKDKYRHNAQPLQHMLSTTCGQWCLYFMWKRSGLHSIKNIQNEFSKSNLFANDILVNELVESIYHTRLKVMDIKFLTTRLENQMCTSRESNVRKKNPLIFKRLRNRVASRLV